MDIKTNLIIQITEDIRKSISSISCGDDEQAMFQWIEKQVISDDRLAFHSFKAKAALVRQIYYSIRKDLGILHPFSEDKNVTEIMVNGKDNIFIERFGVMEKTDQRFTRMVPE